MIENGQPELSGAPLEGGPELKQRRQMLVALALLLLALLIVIVRDRQFWFPGSSTAAEETEATEPGASDATTSSGSLTYNAQPANPARKSRPRPAAAEPKPAVTPAPVVANRAVLPPLEVEVVAGGEHRTLAATNNSIKVDLQPKNSATPAAPAAGVSSAAERVQISANTAQVVSRPVQPNYPLLAKQMKVQGAVVLRALIGKDGNIQDLQVVSGPAILSAAAREAVKQWRFKPYLQDGQAVETEAKITVNFTISTY